MKDICNAVVIDDDQEHVFAVANALSLNGIPTFPIHFKDPVNAYKLCEGVSQSHPRIVIIDIQIVPGVSTTPTNSDYANIVSCVEKLVGKLKGPYILLAWSDKKEHFSELKDYILKYINSGGTTLNQPYFFELIDKTECKVDGESFCFKKIFSKFSMHLNEEKSVKALLTWERKVSNAAIDTINNVIAESGEELQQVLLSLGIGVAGKHLRETKSIALNEALLYILKDKLNLLSVIDPSLVDAWNEAIIIENDPQLTNELRSKLNSMLHIDNNIVGEFTCPGDFWLADSKVGENELLKGVCNSRDDINSLLEKFRHDVFIYKDYEEYASINSKIRQCEDEDKKTELVDTLKKSFVEPMNSTINSSKLAAIEISPMCDFSNKKKAVVTVVLGLFIALDKMSENVTLKDRSDSLIITPILMEGAPYFLIVSAKYVTSITVKRLSVLESNYLKKKFRIRESLLQSWIHKITSYNSRIGTVSYSFMK